MRYHKAQSTVEYAVLVMIIAASLLSMHVYIKRGLQGALRAHGATIGEQYCPGNTASSQETETQVTTKESSRLGLSTTETEETQKKQNKQWVWR
ncbi:MAG: hypothetical protein ISS44_01915 [Candidatus Omnitrophica bacterium]|nr:hypothetical protein [Candidatus Omnitrophota bacterium]